MKIHLRYYSKRRAMSVVACSSRRTTSIRGWAKTTRAEWRFVTCARCVRSLQYGTQRRATQGSIDAARSVPELRTGGFAIQNIDAEITRDAAPRPFRGAPPVIVRTTIKVRHGCREIAGIFTDRLMGGKPFDYVLARVNGHVYEFEAIVMDVRSSTAEAEFTLRVLGPITVS